MSKDKNQKGDVNEPQMSLGGIQIPVKKVEDKKPKEEKVVNIGDVLGTAMGKRLAELEGQVITIEDFVELQGVKAPYVVMKTKEYGDVYTFSRVVIDQLKKMQEWFNAGYKVRAKVTKKGRYWTLTNP
jgi:hypothetical protein